MATTQPWQPLVMPLIQKTLATLGHSHLYDRLCVEWCRSFTRRLGDARYRTLSPRIRFSLPLWPLASEAERRECVIHEVCHIVDMYLTTTDPGYRIRRKNRSHGPLWKALMHQCGAEGSRCHKIQRPESMKRKVARVEMTCACEGRVFRFGPVRMARVKKGYVYRCKVCRATIVSKATFVVIEKNVIEYCSRDGVNKLAAASSNSKEGT